MTRGRFCLDSALVKRLFQFALLGWPIFAICQEAEPETKIPATDLAALEARVGETIVVTGRIENTGRSASGINFLNFEGSEFVAVTFARHLGKFEDGAPADVFEGKWVEIRGEIEMFKGKPQIKLEEPGQIAVVKEPGPEPKPVGVVEIPEPAPAAAEPEPKPEVEPPLQTEPKTAVAPPGGEVELIEGKPPVDWRLYFKD